jgi:hypothetical protein
MPRVVSLTSSRLEIGDKIMFNLDDTIYSGEIKNMIFLLKYPGGWIYSIEYIDINKNTRLIELDENKILYNK